MAQSGYTPISLYFSATGAAVPTAGNLVAGELALNTNDGKLYYKNSSGVVTLLASATTVTNSFSAGTTGLTPNTATTGAVTLAGTLAVANGGTGLTAGTSGGVLAYTATGTLASSTALAASALVIGGGAGAAPSTTTTGTGVVTALGVNTGSAGAFVVNGGALGSPSTAGTMPAFTLGGTVSGGGNQINNVVIGTTTPLAGSFTTLNATGAFTGTTGTFNATAATNSNGIALAGSTTGYNFVGITSTSGNAFFGVDNSVGGQFGTNVPAYATVLGAGNSRALSFVTGGAQRIGIDSAGAVTMSNGLAVTGTLSATGTLSGGTSGTAYSFSGSAPATSLTLTSGGDVGIGTSSPNTKLQVNGGAVIGNGTIGAPASGYQLRITSDNTDYYDFGRNSSTGYFTINASQASPYRGFIWAYGGTAQATLDSAGNLGLGVTPSAWSAGKGLEVGFAGSGVFSYSQTDTELLSNAYYNSGYKFGGTGRATMYQQETGAHLWHTTGTTSGTAGNAITFTQAMTLDASGQLGIGTTSPAAKLDILNTNATYSLSQKIFNASAGTFYIGQSPAATFLSVDNFAMAFCTNSNGGVAGTSIPTNERMRLDSSGSLQLKKASNETEATAQFSIGGSGYEAYHWLDATAYYIGQNSSIRSLRIYSNSYTAGVNLASGGTSWGTFSDERLKYDVEPITNGLNKLNSIRCVSYRLKDVDASDSQKKLGVIAQDLVGVVDEVIDITKRHGDETDYMSVRYTELIPVLVKAIQEQQALITQLTARITALETA